MSTDTVVSEYLRAAFNLENIEMAVKSFGSKRKIFKEYDAIAATGVSGLLVAPILAFKYKEKLTIIRKKDNSHAHKNGPYAVSSLIEGYANAQSIVIVDDFISSGTTIINIVDSLKKYRRIHGYSDRINIAGIFLYSAYHLDETYKSRLNRYHPDYYNWKEVPIVTLCQSTRKVHVE